MAGLDAHFAVNLGQRVYILPETPISNFLVSKITSRDTDEIAEFLTFCEALWPPNDYAPSSRSPSLRESENFLRGLSPRGTEERQLC